MKIELHEYRGEQIPSHLPLYHTLGMRFQVGEIVVALLNRFFQTVFNDTDLIASSVDRLFTIVQET